jgi:DNA processing protein
MTPSDAAGLAILALHDRRLVAAILRVVAARATADDLDALPPRGTDENVLAWACRSRGSSRHRDWEAELRRVAREAADQLARAAALEIVAVPFGDVRYPPLLAVISDPPPMLWVRGDVTTLSRDAVGIVGSRAASPYALEMAKRLAMDLASAGVVVVSGLARGVDSAAHAAALAVRGRTVGVMGSGIDRIYPPEHKDLAADMAQAGAVISEFPPGVPPLPHHFPMRNRIISGLSRAIVVVEAPEKSGALITASSAADQGRDVMAVPGPVTAGRNRGGHLLIRDGAKLVETADDILHELNISPEMPGSRPLFTEFPEMAAFTVDDLSAQTGEPPSVVLAKLLELELAGHIQRIGGGRFLRVLT